MTTRKKSQIDNFQYFIENGIDLENRIVNIFGEIDEKLSFKVISGLQSMSKSKDKSIDIYINSEGGEAYSGFAIYDFIRSLTDIEVNTYVVGKAMSMASIIFLAGDNRYVYPESTLMLHSVSSSAEGKVFLDLEDNTDECKRLYKRMCKIYEVNSCKPYKYWYDALKYKDKFLSAEQAIDFKLATKVK